MAYRGIAILAIAALVGGLAACGEASSSSQDEASTAAPSPEDAATTTTEAPATTTTLSPLEERGGVWEGITEFGTFEFTVSPDGTEVTDFDLVYEEGGMTFSVAPQGDVSLPIDEDDFIDLQLGDTVFEVQFSNDGTSASGYLELEVPMTGNFSEEWEVTR